MERITLQDLHTLWNESTEPCISIFLPTHRKGAGTQADPIVLKNLARHAQARLGELSMREPEARALLAPLDELVSDQAFWREQDAGLALYRSPRMFRHFALAQAPQERVVVSGRFHVRPLLPALAGEAPFHILALSLSAVRLLRANVREVREVPLPDAPQSLADFRKYEDAQPDAQYRQAGEGGTFAAGGHQADRKEPQRRYVRAVAKAVAARLDSTQAPLVFAGVDELYGLYREAAGDERLLPRPIAGNPDRHSPGQLQELALELLRPLWGAEQEQAAAEYRRLEAAGRARTGLEAVLKAALAGRVATLMTRPDAECWGSYFPVQGVVERHATPQGGDDELMDLAAALTLRTGGRWLPLPAALADAPDIEDGIAALLRY